MSVEPAAVDLAIWLLVRLVAAAGVLVVAVAAWSILCPLLARAGLAVEAWRARPLVRNEVERGVIS